MSTVAGEHHASADPVEERHAGLSLEPLELLGDRTRGESQRGRGADHRAVGVDRMEGLERLKIDHEAMLRDNRHDHSLVLHDS